jgi:hypothetical protein
MNPKNKAKQLIDKYKDVRWDIDPETAKQCALIAVDEIINSVVITDLIIAENQFKYWEKVKQEIGK